MSTLKQFFAARETKPSENQVDVPIEMVIVGIIQKPVQRDLIATDPNPESVVPSQEGGILAKDT